jgi:hypothetical protein
VRVRLISTRAAVPDTTEALLRELVEEVRGLRADLARERGRSPARDASVEALLPVLAAAVADRAFTSREVVEHAVVDGALRAALDKAGVVTGRQLGKWLRRAEGRAIAGVRLERIGTDRDGVIWRVRVSRV